MLTITYSLYELHLYDINLIYFSSIEADPNLWGAHVCEIMLDIVIPLVFAAGKVYSAF